MRVLIRQLFGQWSLFLVISCMSVTSVSAAVQVKGLYEVEVPVSNQARQERRRALRTGLSDLITRLTGSQALEEFGQFMSVLDRASTYVEQYRYRESVNPDLKPKQKPDLILWIRFNRKAIQKLLREQQLPLWGSTRPETLVWIVIQDQNGRQLLTANEENSTYLSVLTHARRRGVPVLVPLMDLEDQRKVRVGDIWGGFSGSIKKASTRYATENILVGRVFPVAKGWASRWTMLSTLGEQHWSGTGAKIDKVVAVGFDGLGDLMASRYAMKSAHNDGQFHLKIAAINSLDSYAKASQYLSNLSLITRFHPISFEQGYATFALEISGTLEGLKQVLALEQRLLIDDEILPIQPVVNVNTAPNINTVPNVSAAPEDKTVLEITPPVITINYRLKL